MFCGIHRGSGTTAIQQRRQLARIPSLAATRLIAGGGAISQ